MRTGSIEYRAWSLLVVALMCAWFVACSGSDEPERDARDADAEVDTADIADARDDTELDVVDSEDVDDIAEGELEQCLPCAGSNQCKSGFCATIREGSDVCLRSCGVAAGSCDAGYDCVSVENVGDLCVPRARTCDDSCLGVDCAAGRFCDPETGACEETGRLCDPCTSDVSCGTDEDLCVRFGEADDSPRCGSACSVASDCAADFDCVEVGGGEASRQCIPTSRECENPCTGVDCGPDGFCNPESGDCLPVFGTCSACTNDSQCGAIDARCANLPGPPCNTRADCVLPDASCVGGACEVSYCLDLCEKAGDECSPSERCTQVDDFVSLCLPETLSCEDRCADITCGEAEYCDPVRGQCVPRTFNYCHDNCDISSRCGFEVDGCGDIGDGQSYCLPGCSPPEIICPTGYECVSGGAAGGICYPLATGGCDACGEVICESGTACSPSSGECEPRPRSCNNDAQCDSVSRCAREAGRCIPEFESCEPGVGLCAPGSGCVPTSGDLSDGSCEVRCESPANCSAAKPECVLYEFSEGAVCATAGVDEAQNCAIPRRRGVGRANACTSDLDCSADAQCVDASETAGRSICATPCDSDSDCISDELCVDTNGGDFCIASACDCMNVPENAQGSDYLLDLSLSLNGRSRCDIYRSDIDIRTISAQTEAAQSALIPALVGRATIDPFGAVLDWAFELGQRFDVTFSDPEQFAFDRAKRALDYSLYELRTEPPNADNEGSTSVTLIDEFIRTIDLVKAGAISDYDVSTLVALNSANQGAFKELLYVYRVAMLAAFEGLRSDVFGEVSILTSSDLDALLDRAPTGISSATLDRFSNHWLPQFPIAAAGYVVDAVNRFRGDIDMTDPALAELDVAIKGELGWIILAGIGDDAHVYDGDIALSIDLGGDDTYVGNFAAVRNLDVRPLSVAIDLSGSDRWTYREAWEKNPAGGNLDSNTGMLVADAAGRDAEGRSESTSLRQGACVSGVAQLFDLGEGADSFETLRAGQGFCVLGVGMLVDSQGASSYTMESGGQGAGWLGVGISVTSHDAGQFEIEANGLGSALGGGVGVQLSGPSADNYQRPGRVVFYEQESSSHALFGAGVGGSALTDSLGIAGGIGLFVDPAGSDVYPTATMSFGAGQYAGAGGFVDQAGDDSYSANRRAFGVGEQFGVGLFIEDEGNESFGSASTPLRESFGSATLGGTGVALVGGTVHDYAADNYALGAARSGGFALFTDRLGNDIYQVLSETTLGFADAGLPTGGNVPTFGVFLDGSGTDTWNGSRIDEDGVDDNVSWNRCSSDESPESVCVGADRTRAPLEWPFR